MDEEFLESSRLALSVPGSLLGVSAETRVDPRRFFLRTLHRFADPRDFLGLGLGGAERVDRVEMRAETLRLIYPGGAIEVVFSGPDSVRLRASGSAGELSVAVADTRVVVSGGEVVAEAPAPGVGFRVRAQRGDLEWNGERLVFGSGPTGGEVIIEELAGRPDPGGDFDAFVVGRREEFGSWLGGFRARFPGAHPSALREAAYLLWSCQAGPRDALRRRAVYMSKNWMTGIWSWDNCFNAVALAAQDPALAWDQFVFFFDWQAEDGRLPDLLTARGPDWGMTKPPISGWALRAMRARHPDFAEPERLREVYEPMARQVRFWVDHRDSDGDGMPEYHHGCDSGWDNGTGFSGTGPWASPDLAGWLILQAEELAWMAPLVGRDAEAESWRLIAERLAGAMTQTCWTDDRWRAVHAGTRHPVGSGDSLLPWLGGLAGHRFSSEQKSAVIRALGEEGRFLTPHGVATESVVSPFYEPDGYWRGPVWGPSTVMAVEACRACGEPALGAEIARRFCRMGPDFGFAENHDALTGRGLRDPGYTWTASAWLILQDVVGG